MSPLASGTLGIGAMLLLVFAGRPVGVAMGVVGFVGFAAIAGLDPALAMLGLAPYSSVASYTLTVIPLFILMGQFAAMSGLSRELYETANRWLGHRPGGLAMATVVACGGFAAVCGSSLATSATMAVVALPEMERNGYDPRLSTGSIAAGGTLGILIPPSVMFLIYGFLTEQSIGKLFLAGVVPGVILGYFLAIPQVPSAAASAIGTLPLPAWAVMALIILGYVIMGGFMDELAMVLLTVPIFFPVAQTLGFDPIWFGVIIVVVCEAGMIAPPVAINVFVVSGFAKGIPMRTIYRGVLPFLWADLVLLALLMLFPDLALILPRSMR